jgi:hypothetical protein
MTPCERFEQNGHAMILFESVAAAASQWLGADRS